MPSELFYPILNALTELAPPVIFVQIGANDGITNDPIEPFVRGGKWQGIMVEPVPYVFARLEARYVGRNDLVFENCAIGDADGERSFYSVLENAAEEQSASLISSFSLAHVLKHAGTYSHIGKRIQVRQVQCLTLRTLLAKHHLHHLDALVIDAEGFDAAIVQMIPFDEIRPTVIFYEHQHLNADGRDACRALLEHEGYQFLERHANTLALHKDACAKHSELSAAWERAHTLEQQEAYKERK